MAEKLFFGETSVASAITSTNTGNTVGSGWASTYSGVLTSVGIYSYSASSGNLKFAVYEGGASQNDAASTLAYTSGDESVSSTGWNYYPITPMGVNAGEYYHIALGQGSPNIRTAVPTGSNLYVNGTFSYSFFSPVTPWGTGWTPISTYTSVYAGWGWEPPAVSSIDDSIIPPGATRTLTGTDFMTSANPITVEICNNSNYAAATVKTAQTVTAQADTSVDFTAVTTGLSGASWVFVTTDLGQMNATGLPVTVGRTVYAWVETASGILSAYPHEVLLT